jgi:aspartate/methionine/tyrosine aminotransferase
MAFKRMLIEEWFDTYQFQKDYDIGESGMKFKNLTDLDIDLNQVDLRYGYHLGRPELRELIASQTPGLTAGEIGVTNGAGEAIFALVAALVGPKDHVIVEVPNFPSLYEVPSSLDRDLSYFQLEFEDGFRPDIKRLKSLIKPETRLIVLTHPNNPAGTVISKSELEELIELAEANHAYLLMDETYRELSFEPSPPLAASLSPNAISITSMSKAFGVPGIRIGWVAADEKIIQQVCAVREQVTICNSALGEVIALEVLRRKEWIIEGAKKNMMSNYAILDDWMKSRTDLEWVKPQSGVVGFPRLVQDVAADDLCRLLIKKYRTFVVPGYCFGMPRYFRLGFGGNEAELRAGLSCLDKALSEWDAAAQKRQVNE